MTVARRCAWAVVLIVAGLLFGSVVDVAESFILGLEPDAFTPGFFAAFALWGPAWCRSKWIGVQR